MFVNMTIYKKSQKRTLHIMKYPILLKIKKNSMLIIKKR